MALKELGAAKQKFNAYFSSIYKCFSSFSKYLKTQIEDKNKSVDTQIMGVFIKEDDQTRFYPTVQFLEAGKFKLPRDILKQKGNDDYAKLYQDKTAEQDLMLLNFGALAIVSGIKQD